MQDEAGRVGVGVLPAVSAVLGGLGFRWCFRLGAFDYSRLCGGLVLQRSFGRMLTERMSRFAADAVRALARLLLLRLLLGRTIVILGKGYQFQWGCGKLVSIPGR